MNCTWTIFAALGKYFNRLYRALLLYLGAIPCVKTMTPIFAISASELSIYLCKPIWHISNEKNDGFFIFILMASMAWVLSYTMTHGSATMPWHFQVKQGMWLFAQALIMSLACTSLYVLSSPRVLAKTHIVFSRSEMVVWHLWQQSIDSHAAG